MVVIAQDSNNIAKYLLTDSDGHLQVDVLTSGVISGRGIAYTDTDFVAGDSPATLDVNNDLGRNAKDGFIINDGPGNFTIEISDDGASWSNVFTMEAGEIFSLTNIDVDSIRITHVADSAYRVFVI